MKSSTILTTLLLSILLAATSVLAQSADELMKKSHLAYYYSADDGVAEVTMRIISKRGKERSKQFVMLRLDIEEGGNQMYYTYFRKPSDISRLTFMVHKSPKGNDQRWICIPSVDLVKPISADDKNSSFVGSHFSYEDVSGRHWTEDTHKLLADSTIGERAVHVVQSVPIESYKGFTRKVTYIDQENSLPLREEYFDKKGKMIRLFKAEKIDVIDGITTITVRSMENLKKGGKTVIEFSSIEYNAGLDASLFTERYLMNPPREYIK